MNNTDSILIGSLIGLVVAFCLILIWAVVQDANRWEKFSATHDCKLFAVSSASTAIATNGQIAIVAGKRGWRCNDGMEYWR